MQRRKTRRHYLSRVFSWVTQSVCKEKWSGFVSSIHSHLKTQPRRFILLLCCLIQPLVGERITLLYTSHSKGGLPCSSQKMCKVELSSLMQISLTLLSSSTPTASLKPSQIQRDTDHQGWFCLDWWISSSTALMRSMKASVVLSGIASFQRRFKFSL